MNDYLDQEETMHSPVSLNCGRMRRGQEKGSVDTWENELQVVAIMQRFCLALGQMKIEVNR